jgi:uncharacterized protein (DUF885 family)
MTALAKQQGYSDLESYRTALKNDPKQFAASREQIVERYRKYIDQMSGKASQLVGVLPKAQLVVVPIEPFREKEDGMAKYAVGTPDGSRKGKVYVNTRDCSHQVLFPIEAIAYHEGIPGHHFQISLAQELKGLPEFRRHGYYGAFVEGWGLYAEGLGKEAGGFQEPSSEYGRLTNEMLRAIRLVLDTGVHSKHFTRQQMVDFFHQHSSMDESSLQAEVDSEIAVPAQVLSYKIGQMKLLELRKHAEKELGKKFDIKAFHDEILGGGPLPLELLERKINAFVAAQKH